MNALYHHVLTVVPVQMVFLRIPVVVRQDIMEVFVNEKSMSAVPVRVHLVPFVKIR